MIREKPGATFVLVTLDISYEINSHKTDVLLLQLTSVCIWIRFLHCIQIIWKVFIPKFFYNMETILTFCFKNSGKVNANYWPHMWRNWNGVKNPAFTPVIGVVYTRC